MSETTRMGEVTGFRRTWGESKKAVALTFDSNVGTTAIICTGCFVDHIPMLNTSRMGLDKTDCV